MMKSEDKLEVLKEKLLQAGAFGAEVVSVQDISTDECFREMCAANTCGNYGKNYKCPPDVGDIRELMACIRSYDRALVYQTVDRLEDSYDFEGMMEAAKKQNDLAQQLRNMTVDMGIEDALHLGAGGCRLCSVCGKRTGEPCRFPDRAMPSLEAHGINVSKLAELAGMKYINGQNTVTYFGAVFCKESDLEDGVKGCLFEVLQA